MALPPQGDPPARRPALNLDAPTSATATPAGLNENEAADWPTDGKPVVVEDTRWQPEVRILIKLAAPTIVQGAAQQAMMVTDQLFVGHLGTSALAAAALGTTYSNIMWFFLLGSSTALDTLGAQAFGAGNHAALVTATFTSAVVQSVFALLMSVALCFGQLVAAHLFGQDAEVSAMVGQYCFGLIPGMWPLVLSLTLMKFLQTQNHMYAPALITVTAFLLNIVFNFAFIAAMGFKGAPLATSLSRFCQFILLVIAVYRTERKRRVATSTSPSTANEACLLVESTNSAEDSDDSEMGLSRNSANRPGQLQTASAGCEVTSVVHAVSSRDADAQDEQPLLQLQPVRSDSEQRGPVPGGNTASCSGHAHTPGAPTWQGKKLTKQLSWFRAPSWRASGGKSLVGGEGSSKGVGSTSAAAGEWGHSFHSVFGASAGRFLLSEAKAAVQPHLLKRYLTLALPGGFMLAFEAASFDVTTGMAGHLGSVITAAHAALLGITYFTYSSVPFAVSTAATIRVGNLLGSGQARLARLSGFLAVAIALACIVPVAIVLLSTRHVLGRAFSSDLEVISTMAAIAPYAALLQVADAIMGPSQGVLRGCGRQLQLMCSNVLAFWMFGVFLGYMLAFHTSLRVHGLWIGIASGDFTAAGLNLLAMTFVNWEKEAAKAAEHASMLDAGGGEGAVQMVPLVERSDVSHRRRKNDSQQALATQC